MPGHRYRPIMNADGTGVTRLTNHPEVDTHPPWSPNGKQIAFVSNRSGDDELHVMNANGTGVTRITFSAGPESFPDWR
jgi:TolB protein